MDTGGNVVKLAVLLFGDRSLPRPLRGLPVADPGDIDAAARSNRRLIVVGSDADLAAVLTRLLRIEQLDVEIGYVPQRRITRHPRLPATGRASGGSPSPTPRRPVDPADSG